ncbi:MAG TPA: Crp/Fnr family transcriptional regulator [Stellaceae bacterium]|nr:Crp/Fnr family transcriptional regulator [Stellaceae bacterium]
MNSIGALVQNSLLAAIGSEARDFLGATGVVVDLPLGDIIRSTDEKADQVWFPLSGMVSLTIPLQDGTTVEAGLVGREGVVGLSSLLDGCEPADEAMIQLPGQAFRVECNAFKELMERDRSTMLAVLRCSHDLFALVAQTAVCNVRHDVLQRLARWILLSHDRADGNTMPLTHELLGIMLGVQRNTVTVAAQSLQQQGAIQYTRGRLTVIDRTRLERLACECYTAVQGRLSGYARAATAQGNADKAAAAANSNGG